MLPPRFLIPAFFASHVAGIERDVRDGRLRPPTSAQLDAIEAALRRPPPGRGHAGAPPAGLSYADRRDPGGRADPGGYSDDRDQGPAYAARRDPGAYAPAAPAAAPAAPAVPAGLKHQGLEQLEWSVRVDEFHGLSPLAKYVHPAAALKLQQLWDQGNRLVSLLDDSSWERLARLDTQAAVATVNEAAEALRTLPPDDLVAANAAFVTIASRFAGGGRAGGPGAGPGPVAAAVPAAAPYAPIAGGYAAAPPAPGRSAAQPPYAYGSGPGPTAAGPHRAGLPARPGPYKSAGPPIYTTGPVARLTPAVQQQLAEAVATSRGLLRPEHFNEGLVDMLLVGGREEKGLVGCEQGVCTPARKSTTDPHLPLATHQELGDSEASSFLGRLGARDLSQVRNMSGYIYGTLRRGEGLGGPAAGGAGPGMHAPGGRPDLAGPRQLAGPRYRPYLAGGAPARPLPPDLLTGN